MSIGAQLAVVTVPFLGPLFKVAPIASGRAWLMMAALAVTPVGLLETAKLVRGYLRRHAAGGGS